MLSRNSFSLPSTVLELLPEICSNGRQTITLRCIWRPSMCFKGIGNLSQKFEWLRNGGQPHKPPKVNSAETQLKTRKPTSLVGFGETLRRFYQNRLSLYSGRPDLVLFGNVCRLDTLSSTILKEAMEGGRQRGRRASRHEQLRG